MQKIRLIARWLPLFFAVIALASSDEVYRAASIDDSGQLHITLNNGNEVLPPRLHGQAAFSSPGISADHRTVGWLAQYPNPFSEARRDLLSGALVLYRNGRILHRFDTDQIFWDWHFQDGGKRVAYSTGPTHRGAAECVLIDASSGKVIARWSVTPNGTPPGWAEPLRR